MFNENITNKLKDLHNVHGAYALKASFEDEGVTDCDLSDLVLLSGGTGLKVYVKIGGCEANRDIERCLRLGIKGIVAPMVESRFALQKFSESINKLPYDGNKFINIEKKLKKKCKKKCKKTVKMSKNDSIFTQYLLKI